MSTISATYDEVVGRLTSSVSGANEPRDRTTSTSNRRKDMKNRSHKRDPLTVNIDLLVLATQCLVQAIRSIIISIVLSLYLAYQAAMGLLVAFGGCLMFTFHVLRALPILLVASALIPVAFCALVMFCTASIWDEVQRPIVASIHQLTVTMVDHIHAQRNRLEERLRYIANVSRVLSISTNRDLDSMPPASTTLTSLGTSPSRSRNSPLSSFPSPNKQEYHRRRQSVSSLKAWSPTLSPVPSVSGSISGSSRASSVNISCPSSRNTTYEVTLERPIMDYDSLPLASPLPMEFLHDDHDSGAKTDLEHSKEITEQFWGTIRIPSPKTDRQFISLARMKSENGVARGYFPTGGLKSLAPMNLRTTTTSTQIPLGNEVD